MKLVKTLAVAALAFSSMATQASMITVGGVTWDTDYTDAADNDFLGEFKFNQWYSSTASANYTLDNYDQAAKFSEVNGSLNPLIPVTSTGYYLQGIGEFDRINGLFSPDFCNGCELLFGFGGIVLNTDSTFNFDNAWARVWTNNLSPNYTVPASNQTEVTAGLVGVNNPWLDLKFEYLQFSLGGVQNGTVSAIFQVIGGLAQDNFLDSPLGGKIAYTADAFYNVAADAKYSSTGNGSVTSDTVPAPSSLAVLGLGLLGLAGAARRKQAK